MEKDSAIYFFCPLKKHIAKRIFQYAIVPNCEVFKIHDESRMVQPRGKESAWKTYYFLSQFYRSATFYSTLSHLIFLFFPLESFKSTPETMEGEKLFVGF